MTAPILTEEQIMEAARVHGENVSSVKSDQNAAIHDFTAGARFAIAAAAEREAKLVEALKDAVAGLHYIEESHGRLYGVGWDRVEEKFIAALALVKP